MTSLQTPTVRVGDSDPDQIRSSVLAQGDADTYAQWFACLAEPMRVRLLHRVASAVGGITVGALAEALGGSGNRRCRTTCASSPMWVL